ncbi:hypothetical protein ACLB1G_01000 [Oxalobacteraceae bacterium A2-2]
MKLSARTNFLIAICSLMLPLMARASLPCRPAPCDDENSSACKEATEWMAEGMITEIRYKNVPAYPPLPRLPGEPDPHFTVPATLVFAPIHVIQGNVPAGELIIQIPSYCFRGQPTLDDLRRALPVVVRVKAGVLLTFSGGQKQNYVPK